MKRVKQKMLAVLLSACLLSTYTPIPAMADNGLDDRADESFAGEAAALESGGGSTAVDVLAVPGLVLDITDDFAASIEEIDGNPNFDLKVEAQGNEPFTYQWHRSVLTEKGEPRMGEKLTDATEPVYPLSQHADTLENNTDYLYTVKVTDAKGVSKESTVRVGVSDGYRERTLPNKAMVPRVHGLSIHESVYLAFAELSDDSAEYGFLQQAADGLQLDRSAWQLDFTDVAEGKKPFVGELAVTIPVALDLLPDGATTVQVVGLDASGKVSTYTATVDQAAGTATFTVEALGAFAACYPVSASDTFTITATAGEGGAIDPIGATSYAKGAKAVYTVLPDAEYRVKNVRVDGASVALVGNTYTFDSVTKDAAIEVTFERVVPVDPNVEHTVTALVSGGHGLVSLSQDDEPAETATTQVKDGKPAIVQFVPDDGYILDKVTVKEGDVEAQPVRVFGNTFLLSAVIADTVVTATYKPGVLPPLPTHTVTASVEGEGGSVSPDSQTVRHAGTAILSIQPSSDYRLDKVTVNGKDATGRVQSDGSLVLQNVVQDVDVSVSFALAYNTYTITASAGSGGSITPSGACTYREGEDARFLVRADQGYELAELLVDGEPAEVSDGVYVFEGVDEDHSIEASFEATGVEPPAPGYATVSATAGEHGAISPSGDVRVDIGADCTFSLIPDAGYTVDQVMVDGQDQTDEVADDSTFTLKNITADAEVSVSFKEADPNVPVPTPTFFGIVASASTGGIISPAGAVQVVEGRTASFHFTADEGYRLAKLIVDGEDLSWAEASYTFENVSADHSIQAVFERDASVPEEPDYVTLHASAEGGGAISPEGDVRVPYGSAQSFTLIPDEGQVLDKVTVNGEPTETDGLMLTLFDLRVDADIVASFRAKTSEDPDPVPPELYTIESSAKGAGIVSPSGTTTVVRGGSVLYSFYPDKGHEVAKVVVDGVDVTATLAGSAYRFTDVAENHAIQVTFAPTEGSNPSVPVFHTVTAIPSEGGTVSPEKSMVPDGGSQTFYLLPDADHKVAAIQVDGGEPFAFSGSSYTLFNVEEDIELRVTFEKKAEGDPDTPPAVTFPVTTSIDGEAHGTVSPAPGTTTSVIKGGSLLVSFQPDDGYEVNEVKVNGTLVQKGGLSYRAVNIAEETNISVSFEEAEAPVPETDYARVTVEALPLADGGVGGMVSPGGSFLVVGGSSQNFYAYPYAGYDVDAVTVNDKPVPFHALSAKSLKSRMAGSNAASMFQVKDIREDIHVKVSFKKVEDGQEPTPVPLCTVRASASSGGMISPSGSVVIPKGQSLAYSLKPDAGYHVRSLTVGGKDVTSDVSNRVYTLENVQEDTVIRAVFEADPVVPEQPYATIHAIAGKGGTISPAGDIRIKKGESESFVFKPLTGYVIDRVLVDDKEVFPIDSGYTLFDVKEDVTLRVTFRERTAEDPEPVIPVTHKITAHATTGGGIWPNGVTDVAHGSSLAYFFMADAGYELAWVLVDGKPLVASEYESGVYRFANVGEDHSIVVGFQPASSPTKVKVTALAGEHGSIEPAGEREVDPGSSLKFTFAPDEGYVVDRVDVNGVPVPTTGSSYTLFDIQEDTIISVSFKKADAKLFSVTATAGEHGLVKLSDAEPSALQTVAVAEGGAATVRFFPNEGYLVDQVFVDDAVAQVGGDSYTLSNVQKETNVRVTFKEKSAPDPDSPFINVTVNVKVTGDGKAGGFVNPSGTFKVVHSASQIFYAYPEEGYVLEEVRVNDVPTPFYPVEPGVDPAFDYPQSRMAAPMAAAAPGAYGAYWFRVDSLETDTVVEVSFRPLANGEEQPPAVETHEVNASASDGGTISPDGVMSVPDGGSMSYSLKAEEGYHLESLMVNGVDQTSQVENGVFTLTGVRMDTTVRATFASDQQAAGKRVIQASVRSGYGEVSPEGAVFVNEGADSSFHFQPASGYRVAALVLDGEEVPYTAESYTFEDVREDHALEVVFASATSPGGPDPVGKLAQRVATGDAPWLLVCAVVAVVAAGVALAAHRRSRKRNSRGW